jgi:hypothetical protein
LYYPWRHFQDDDWVKLALLAWDKIVRVRPQGLPDRDSAMIRWLQAETGLFMETSPSSSDLAEVTSAFAEVTASRPEELMQQLTLDAPRPDDDQYAMAESNAPIANRYPRFDLYAGPAEPTVSQELADLLRSLRLAEQWSDGMHDWLSVGPRLGSAYLASLADVIARRNVLSPATDSGRMHRALGALDRIPEMLLDDDQPALGLEDPDSAYLHVALNAVLQPSGLADVRIDTLITFRQRYHAELEAFRQHISGLSGELVAIAAVENLDVTTAHLESLYERVTRPQLDELRKALRGLGIESGIGAMGLKLDVGAAAGTIAGAAASAEGHWAVAGMAAVLAVVPYAASIRKKRRELAASPVAFLLAADRTLSGRSLLRGSPGYPRAHQDGLHIP